MDKKIIIVAVVLLGGAACVYAVTEMGDEELSAMAPSQDDGVVDEPPRVPPMQVDAGTDFQPQAPDEPEGALDPIIQRQLASGVLSHGPSCGGNTCEAGELCCVNTGECVASSCTDCCRGPEEAMVEPPLTPE